MRYDIASDDDKKAALLKTQAHLKSQATSPEEAAFLSASENARRDSTPDRAN